MRVQFNKVLENTTGFRDTSDFAQALLHFQQWKPVTIVTSILTILAAWVEDMLGIKAVVVTGIIILFVLELFTGIRASIKDGFPIDSKKFPRGWIKLFVYFSLIFCANIFAKHMAHLEYGDFDFNHYQWIHYALVNFAIVQLFLSNIENCVRLGWHEYLPLIGWFADRFKIKKTKDEEK